MTLTTVKVRPLIFVCLMAAGVLETPMIVAAESASTLQGDMNSVLSGDPRNAGLEIRVTTRGDGLLVYDLLGVAGSNSMADVFRVFLQFAHAEVSKSFSSVELRFRSQLRFDIQGSYFHQLGVEEGAQNPVYTARTFPEHLLKPDGSAAYSKWTGGLIGVTSRQMEDFNDFHRRWWLQDILQLKTTGGQVSKGPPPSAPVPEQPVERPSAANNRSPAPEPGLIGPTEPSSRSTPPRSVSAAGPRKIPAWLQLFPDARNIREIPAPGEISRKYFAPSPPDAVAAYLRTQLQMAGVALDGSFNGIGITLRAAGLEDSCVIRLTESGGGSEVTEQCSARPAQAAVQLKPNPSSFNPSSFVAAGPAKPLPEGFHRVQYQVDGSARRASLTYQNASGGTEQKTVALPVSMVFDAPSGRFVYLSAQNGDQQGTIHVAITVDGRVLQEATSSSRYGIATASGRLSP